MEECLARAKCPTCGGSGIHTHTCRNCNGTGIIITNDDDGNEIAETCGTCDGAGLDDICETCGGTGEV